MQNKNNIYFDGASSPHKKNFAASAWLCEACNTQNIQGLFPFTTNNRAELIALWMAVGHWFSHHRDMPNFKIMGDSKVAINQYRKTCTRGETNKLFRRSKNAKLFWIPREQNLAGKLLEEYRKSKTEGGEVEPIRTTGVSTNG